MPLRKTKDCQHPTSNLIQLQQHPPIPTTNYLHPRTSSIHASTAPLYLSREVHQIDGPSKAVSLPILKLWIPGQVQVWMGFMHFYRFVFSPAALHGSVLNSAATNSAALVLMSLSCVISYDRARPSPFFFVCVNSSESTAYHTGYQ